MGRGPYQVARRQLVFNGPVGRGPYRAEVDQVTDTTRNKGGAGVADGAPVAARPEADDGGGLVLVASGNGPAGPWSYWWPAADWAELDQAERRRVKRRARSMYSRPIAEGDRA